MSYSQAASSSMISWIISSSLSMSRRQNKWLESAAAMEATNCDRRCLLIFDAPCLFYTNCIMFCLHFVAFLCIFRN
jgi:hypothetical protein